MDATGTICSERSQASLGRESPSKSAGVWSPYNLEEEMERVGGGGCGNQCKGRLLKNLVGHGWADLPGMAHS